MFYNLWDHYVRKMILAIRVLPVGCPQHAYILYYLSMVINLNKDVYKKINILIYILFYIKYDPEGLN